MFIESLFLLELPDPAVYALTSIDSHTLILSNIVTAAFLGKTKEFELIFDFMLSGVSSQELDPLGLASVFFLLIYVL
jgi:hypothetical protein